MQLGTAFLPCPESGAPAAYKRALLDAKKDTTVITRAFSGRPARGLTNTFIAMVDGKEHAILPFRQQNDLTRPMRNASGQQGVAEFISLWAGQGVARSRAMPAADLVRTLIEETSVTEVARRVARSACHAGSARRRAARRRACAQVRGHRRGLWQRRCAQASASQW